MFSQGIGINYGAMFHWAAMLLIKKNFTMVEDSVSKIKTPSIMAFCSDKRYFEY